MRFTGRVLIWALPLFTLKAVQAASAPDIEHVALDAEKIHYFQAAHAQPSDCWGAAVSMVLDYYDIHLDKERVTRKVERVLANTPVDAWSTAIEKVSTNINNWAFDADGHHYQMNAVLVLGHPNPKVILTELLAHHPVIIEYGDSEVQHPVVITEADYEHTAAGNRLKSVTVQDPWPSETHLASHGREEYSAAELSKNAHAAWIIRVAERL